MSIKLKQRAEFEDFGGGCPGAIATTSLCGIWKVPFACILKAVDALLGTAGGTQATIVDVQRSTGGGAFASIFSGATKINFASGSQSATYGALTTNPQPLIKGDILKAVVTQVGSAPAPADLALSLVFQKQSGSGVVTAMVTGGVGPEAGVGA